MTFFTSYQNYFRSFLPENQQTANKVSSPSSKLEQKTRDSARTSLENPLESHSLEHVRHSVKTLSTAELKELDKVASQTHAYLNSIKDREIAIDKNMLRGLQAAEKVLQAIELERDSRAGAKGKSLLTLIRMAKKLGLPGATPTLQDMSTQANRKRFQEKLANQIHEKVSAALSKGATEIRSTDALFLLDSEVALHHLKKTLGDKITPSALKAWDLKYGPTAAHLVEAHQAVLEDVASLKPADWLKYHAAALTLENSPLFPFTSQAEMKAVQFFLPKREEEQLAKAQSLGHLCHLAKSAGVDIKATVKSTIKSLFAHRRRGEHPSLKNTFQEKLAEQTLAQVGNLLSMGKTKGDKWDSEEILTSLMRLDLKEGSDASRLRSTYFEKIWEWKYGDAEEALRKAFNAFLRGEDLTGEELKNCDKLAVRLAYSPLLKYTEMPEIVDFFIDDLYSPPPQRVYGALIGLEKREFGQEAAMLHSQALEDFVASKYSAGILNEILDAFDEELKIAVDDHSSEDPDALYEEFAELKKEWEALMGQNKACESQDSGPVFFTWESEEEASSPKDIGSKHLNIFEASELRSSKDLFAQWEEIYQLYEQIVYR